MKIEYNTTGVCPNKIEFEIIQDKVYNIKFYGGCPGNTKMIAKLLDGWDYKKIIKACKGNLCGIKNTSCADQLAVAIEKNVSEKIVN